MLRSKTLSSLDIEFRPILQSMSLPPHLANSGIQPRTRTRRNFAANNKDDTSTAAQTTTSSSRSTSDDESADKKRAPIYKGEDMKLDDKDNDEDDTQGGGKKTGKVPVKQAVPEEKKAKEKKEQHGSSKKKPPLVKMRTHDSMGDAVSKHKHHKHRSSSSSSNKRRSEPSAYIDVTTDSIDRHRPDNLPAPAPYMDVEGVDPIQPAYMGMTVEQWRAFKRANDAHDQEYALEDALGNIGEGGDW